MKKLFVILMLIPAAAVAQEEIKPEFTLPRAVIKLAPLQFFSNTLELSVETFNRNYNRSLEVSVGFRSGYAEYEDGRGASLELGYRKYVSPMKIHVRKGRQFYQGIYYNVAVKGSYFKGAYEGYYYDPNTGVGGYYEEAEVRMTSIAPSFTLGLQKTLWQIILLDVYVGGGIRFAERDRVNHLQYSDPYYYNDDDLFGPAYDGIYPKIGARIGVGL